LSHVICSWGKYEGAYLLLWPNIQDMSHPKYCCCRCEVGHVSRCSAECEIQHMRSSQVTWMPGQLPLAGLAMHMLL
jgi:hypothetical protein